MTVHDPALSSGGFTRLLELVGWRRTSRTEDPLLSDSDESSSLPAEHPRERRRRQTLDDICSFLVAHRLTVSPFTLQIAHDVITGSDAGLARQVAARVAHRQLVTIGWLEDITQNKSVQTEAEQLQALMQKMETAIEELADTTRAARCATTDYHSALEDHVEDLDKGSKVAPLLKLASLAHDMLNRTQTITQQLARSERQTRSLQRRLAQARREAEIDHLTGLPNRRAFDHALAREQEAVARTGETLCVAFCDIDNFKRVNDIHGHEAGDRVLRSVAQSLAELSGDRCHVARHGGEEFVILLRGHTLNTAFELLDQARETMASRRMINRATDRPYGRISFSAGIAELAPGGNASAALAAADQALYEAKKAGRNQVHVANASHYVLPETK